MNGNEGMDLATLIAVFRRRWKGLLSLPLLVGLLSWATTSPPPVVYQTRLAFAVDIPRSALLPGSDEGTAAKIGESLVDDLARLMGRDQFALAVTKRLPAGLTLGPGELAGELSAEDKHRILDLTISRSLPGGASVDDVSRAREELRTIALAVEAEIEENGNAWFARLGEDAVVMTLIDAPEPAAALPPTLRQRLELPLRLLLAFLVAMALVAVREGLDRRIHDAAAVQAALGAAPLGSIPRRR